MQWISLCFAYFPNSNTDLVAWFASFEKLPSQIGRFKIVLTIGEDVDVVEE